MAPLNLTSLHVDTGTSWRGGQRQLILLVDGLRRRGHLAHILCQPESPVAQAAADLGLAWSPLDSRGALGIGAVWELRRWIDWLAPAIVHAHDPRAHGLCLLSRMDKQEPAPGPEGEPGTAPRLVVHRRVDFPVGQTFLSNLKYRREGVEWIAVSEAVRAMLVAGGVAAERIRVVRSAVPAPAPSRDRDAVRRGLGVEAGRVLIGALGHLADHKGHDVLVDAAARMRQPAAIVVVGEGERRRALEAQILRLGLRGRVMLAGFREDTADVLAALDLLVHPSRAEGLGTVLMEALLMEIPVVASQVGGIPEILADGAFGALVPPGDATALAQALDGAVADPTALRASARAGRLSVEASGGVGRMVDEILAVYMQIMGAQLRSQPRAPAGAEGGTWALEV